MATGRIAECCTRVFVDSRLPSNRTFFTRQNSITVSIKMCAKRSAEHTAWGGKGKEEETVCGQNRHSRRLNARRGRESTLITIINSASTFQYFTYCLVCTTQNREHLWDAWSWKGMFRPNSQVLWKWIHKKTRYTNVWGQLERSMWCPR